MRAVGSHRSGKKEEEEEEKQQEAFAESRRFLIEGMMVRRAVVLGPGMI